MLYLPTCCSASCFFDILTFYDTSEYFASDMAEDGNIYLFINAIHWSSLPHLTQYDVYISVQSLMPGYLERISRNKGAAPDFSNGAAMSTL